MITVEDEVFNETSEIIELTNFSYLRRKIIGQKINFLYYMRDHSVFLMIP